MNNEFKRQRIREDVEKLCWQWNIYPNSNAHLKLYEDITDRILKANLKQTKKEKE